MTETPKVFVVDDDPDVRISLERLFGAVQVPVELYECAEQFIDAQRLDSPGCLLLDVRMPGMGGMQLLGYLQTMREHPPVILLTAHGDIPMVVHALKTGALDFIEKPANPQKLIDAVQNAFAVDRKRRAEALQRTRLNQLLQTLSPRERQVLERMTGGVCNKTIALELAISERTLEKHRKNIMLKLGVRSLAQLICMMVNRH